MVLSSNTTAPAAAGRLPLVSGCLDDDDIWLPYKLRMQVPAMESEPEAGADLAMGEWRGTIVAMFVRSGMESADPLAALEALERGTAHPDSGPMQWSKLAGDLTAAVPGRERAAATAMRRAVRHRPLLLRHRRTLALVTGKAAGPD